MASSHCIRWSAESGRPGPRRQWQVLRLSPSPLQGREKPRRCAPYPGASLSGDPSCPFSVWSYGQLPLSCAIFSRGPPTRRANPFFLFPLYVLRRSTYLHLLLTLTQWIPLLLLL